MSKQQAPRKTEYDVFGNLVDPYGEVQYVSTEVANAFRVSNNYERTSRISTTADFKQKHPTSYKIITEWMSSHDLREGVFLVENNDLSRLVFQ